MISHFLQGYFGNHLFQYAITRIVAEKNGYQFNMPDIFIPKKLIPNIDIGSSGFIQAHSYGEDNKQTYNPAVFNVPDNTLLYGFYQSEKYFEGYEDKIKEWFKMEDANIEDFENTCYIHFRAYDVGSWIYLPKEYYDKAKQIMLKENPNMKFKVITNNIERAKPLFEGDEIISDEENNIEGTVTQDFNILRSAKYLIIGNSTFSWWAAWLNNKVVLTIAPEKWYNYNKKDTDEWFPIDIYSKKFTYIN